MQEDIILTCEMQLNMDLRSDVISPHGADEQEHSLEKDDAQKSQPNPPPTSYTPKSVINKFRYGQENESGEEHCLIGEKDSFDESFHEKYRGLLGENSPEIESDLDKDELRPDSPGEEGLSDSNQGLDYSQALPSNLPSAYLSSSSFSAEEARLRFSLESSQLKNRLSLASAGIAPYAADEILHRRYSLQDSAHDPVAPVSRAQARSPGVNSNNSGTGANLGHSSQPTSPRPGSVHSSPFRSPSHQYSIQNIAFEEQDNRNLLPRIKEGLFFCHLCSFSGSTQGDFDNHMTIHFEHICPHCDYKSRTEGRLKRHIKDFHTEDPEGGYGARTMPGRPKVFRCKQCEYSTTEKIDFWTHSRSHIKEDKLLQCPRCPFVTEYKHHLEYHLRNHFGSKPFKCPKCNYACVNKSMLNSHMKSHTNVYQYRCADCTYATKYCHSLKLHLRKYNHKPAAVLNSDGSLPQGVDATASGLSLLAKRGPPRGPRGPRKDKVEPSPNNFIPMPPSPLGPLPGLPGMISPFWPMLHNQMQGMQARLPHPLTGFGQRFGPQIPGFNPLGGATIKTEEMKSPPPSSGRRSPAVSPNSFKCNFCSFVATNREILTSHVMKVHATENSDLFSMFGLSSESLLEEGKKRAASSMLGFPMKPSPNMAARFELPQPHSRGGLIDSLIKEEKIEKPAHLSEKHPGDMYDSLKMSPFSLMSSGKFAGESNGNVKDEGIDILKQMTLKFGSGPMDLKRKLPPTALSPPVSRGSSSNMSMLSSSINATVPEGPLDLTKPRTPENQTPVEHVSRESVRHHYTRDEADHSSEENSLYSNTDIASPPPRKRSRKGRAFKLDTLCMKLQEKQGNLYESGSDSIEDIDESFKAELLPVEAGNGSPGDVQAAMQAEVNGKDLNDNDDDAITEGKDKDIEGYRPENLVDESCEGEQEEGSNDVEEVQDLTVPVSSRLDVAKEITTKMTDENTAEDKDVIKSGKDSTEDVKGEIEDEGKTGYSSDDQKPESTPPTFPNQSRRKQVPAAIQRGADIAWKILNDPHLGDPSQYIKNGNNGHKLEMTPLDKKLWFEAPECTNHLQKAGEYECPHCQISFGDCIMYTMHMGYHGYKDPYKCNMCGDTCKDRVEFFLHIARAAHN